MRRVPSVYATRFLFVESGNAGTAPAIFRAISPLRCYAVAVYVSRTTGVRQCGEKSCRVS